MLYEILLTFYEKPKIYILIIYGLFHLKKISLPPYKCNIVNTLYNVLEKNLIVL